MRRPAHVALLPRGATIATTFAPPTRTPTVKVNEFLYRRVDIEDVVDAHLLALERAPAIGFGQLHRERDRRRSPASDVAELADDAPRVVARLFPDQEAEYARRGWTMFPRLDRVYVNAKARAELGWEPRYDFRHVLDLLKAGEDFRSAARAAPSAPRATTRSPPGPTRCADAASRIIRRCFFSH